MPDTHPTDPVQMNENKIKESLKIRPVGLKHLDQYNELLRYVFQVTDRELEKSGYEDGELKRSKRPILQEADVFGWFTRDDKLVSQICIYPCEVNIHDRILHMGGVTGVGTYPEFSGMGLMNDLIRHALLKMRKAGQFISYLYPYSIPYYRRKGWEIISDHITFTLKDTEIPGSPVGASRWPTPVSCSGRKGSPVSSMGICMGFPTTAFRRWRRCQSCFWPGNSAPTVRRLTIWMIRISLQRQNLEL